MGSSARRLAALSGLLAGTLLGVFVLLGANRAAVVAGPAAGWAAIATRAQSGESDVVLQDRPRNCGAAALATAARRLGLPVSLREAERLTRTGSGGATLLGLRDGARALGLLAKGVRFGTRDARTLLSLQPPVILRVRGPHFVVLEDLGPAATRPGRREGRRRSQGEIARAGWSERRVIIADPAIGRVPCRARDLARRWSGEALLLALPPGSEALRAR